MRLHHVLPVLFVSLAAGCKPRPTGPDPVAIVNGAPISRATLQKVVAWDVARYPKSMGQVQAAALSNIENSVVRRLIDDEIVVQKAQAENITVSDAELAIKLQGYKNRFADDTAYRQHLQQIVTNEESLTHDFRQTVLRERLIDKLGGAAGDPYHNVMRKVRADAHVQIFIGTPAAPQAEPDGDNDGDE